MVWSHIFQTNGLICDTIILKKFQSQTLKQKKKPNVAMLKGEILLIALEFCDFFFFHPALFLEICH